MFENIKLNKQFAGHILPKQTEGDYIGMYKHPFVNMQTLKQTTMFKWFAYVPELDITIRTDKKTDTIEKVWKGRKWDKI